MRINLTFVICGVDEAGKGSVLGPMVVAAVGARSADVFSDIGVKDSKQLTPAERERLFPLIKKRCKVAVVIIPAEEIDAIRREMTMNACVARAHVQVIQKLAPDTAYVDACDVNPLRYARQSGAILLSHARSCRSTTRMIPIRLSRLQVSIAKVTRDREIFKLAKKYGEIGSGYPSIRSPLRTSPIY